MFCLLNIYVIFEQTLKLKEMKTTFNAKTSKRDANRIMEALWEIKFEKELKKASKERINKMARMMKKEVDSRKY